MGIFGTVGLTFIKKMLNNKTFWIITIIGLVSLYTCSKINNEFTLLKETVASKDVIITNNNIKIGDLVNELTIKKLEIAANKATIKEIQLRLEKYSKEVEDLKTDNDAINNIIEDNKKNKPSDSIKLEGTKNSEKKYTKYKGIRYEEI